MAAWLNRAARAASMAVVLGGCSGAQYGGPDKVPGFTVPTPIAEGKRGEDEPAVAAAPPAVADAGAPEAPVSSLPDPEPLRQKEQWRYEIVYERGELRVASVKSMVFPHPVVTARQMGRYALELWIGHELIDRVRFDFPMLAAEEPRLKQRPRPVSEPPTLGAAVSVSKTILVPASPRATRAVLVDRATGETLDLPWPPNAPAESAPRASTPALPQRATKGSASAPLRATLGSR